jgi:hypothetical protein
MNSKSHTDILLQDVPEQVTRDDIALVLRHNFEGIRSKNHISSTWPGEERIQAIATIAVTICRYVGQKGWIPEERLDSFLNGPSLISASSRVKACSIPPPPLG